MRRLLAQRAVLILSLWAAACGGDSPAITAPTAPTFPPGTVQFIFRGPTALRTDLTTAQMECVANTTATHVHPSWREYNDVFMTPVGADRYELTMEDVPMGQPITVTVWDRNWCDRGDPYGYVLRNVSANGVDLQVNASVGTGPGFTFSVNSSGRVTQ